MNAEQLQAGLELGLTWGRLASRHSPQGSRVRELFVICAQNFGWRSSQEVGEVSRADIDEATKSATCADLLRKAVASRPRRASRSLPITR